MTRARVEIETLTDGSKVFNVILALSDGNFVKLAAVNEGCADKICDLLDDKQYGYVADSQLIAGPRDYYVAGAWFPA